MMKAISASSPMRLNCNMEKFYTSPRTVADFRRQAEADARLDTVAHAPDQRLEHGPRGMSGYSAGSRHASLTC